MLGCFVAVTAHSLVAGVLSILGSAAYWRLMRLNGYLQLIASSGCEDRPSELRDCSPIAQWLG